MATDAQSLLTQAQCYECFTGNPYMADLAILALLSQIVKNQNAMADTTPQTLLAAARCYECYASNSYMLRLMELALLAQIVSNGSVGGGGGSVVGTGGVTHGVAAPVAAPEGNDGVYVQGTGPGVHVWVWDGAAWQQII